MVLKLESTNSAISEDQIIALCTEAFGGLDIDDKRLLFIIPDHSRTAPIDVMFRVLYRLLESRVQSLDFLIALGTHPPMSVDAIYHRIGISEREHKRLYLKARFFNHHWKDDGQLKKIGIITEDEV